jgi:hypothetical protein
MTKHKRLCVEQVVDGQTEQGNAVVRALTHTGDVETSFCKFVIAATIPEGCPVKGSDTHT